MNRKIPFLFATTAVAAMVLAGFASCSKKDGASASGGGKEPAVPAFKVDGVKVTDDIDSTFKVQAVVRGDGFGSGNYDLGIVGTIADGKLSIDVPFPTDEQLNDPGDLDLGSDVEGVKIGQVDITTSKSRLTLENAQSGGEIVIWYANKDAGVDFFGNTVSLKKGWNFIEAFEGQPVSDGKVWVSFDTANAEGYYTWHLAAK